MAEKKDIQARGWQLTINNPAEKNLGHKEIKEILTGIPSMVYWCMCDEVGEQGTPHTHVYFKTRNPVKFSTLKNKVPTAHIEKAQGTPQENRDYIRKEGKWEDTEKKETNLPETFEQWGECPDEHQGRRSDLEYLYYLVKSGLSDSEIIELCPDTAIKFVDKISRLRHIYLTDKFKEERRLNLRVHYITGRTGTGKSRDILDEHGDRNVYRVTDYQHPFDSYQCEPVIAFEEYRSSLRLQEMLNYLDIYPLTLPARYVPKVACYTTVYVVSNWEFEQQYYDLQKDYEQRSSYEAFIRRFNGYVKEYYDIGKYKIYDSMQDYLHRNEQQFQPVPQNVKTPFDESEELQQEKLNLNEPEMPFEG